MTAIKRWGKDNIASLVTFPVIFILLILFMISSKEENLMYDASYYWSLGKGFWDPAVYTEDWRGYVFPAFLGLLSTWGGVQPMEDWQCSFDLNSVFIPSAKAL